MEFVDSALLAARGPNFSINWQKPGLRDRQSVSYNSRHMETATAATSASPERGAADRQAVEHRQQAGRRLKELAAQLDLHRGFADVVASLEAGHGGTLGGVWGSSRALVAAALAGKCPGPLVVVAPHPGEIDAIARDLALFSDARVDVFPAWESEPGERVLHDEIFGTRLRVLKTLAEPVAPGDGRKLARAAPVIVTSIQSFCSRCLRAM